MARTSSWKLEQVTRTTEGRGMSGERTGAAGISPKTRDTTLFRTPGDKHLLSSRLFKKRCPLAEAIQYDLLNSIYSSGGWFAREVSEGTQCPSDGQKYNIQIKPSDGRTPLSGVLP